MADAPAAPLRLAFAGTPDYAATILRALIDAGYPVLRVLTQPDRVSGRGRRPRPTPVKALAIEAGIPVSAPERLRGAPGRELAGEVSGLRLDVLVVAAYGLILPSRFLELPRLGCINVHASLLPRWRGAAPVERAMMAGDAQTGVSLMRMDEGLDTGPVYHRRSLAIEEHMTGDELSAALAELGARSLLELLPMLEELRPTPQPESGACYAPKLTAADARIDWHRSAVALARQVRALATRMPAVAMLDGERIRLLFAQRLPQQQAPEVAASPGPPGELLACRRDGFVIRCGEGLLRLTRLQLTRGKGRAMEAKDALNGHPTLFRPGRVFHAPE